MEHTDYQGLATAVDQMLEIVRSLVAALVVDGFTDREARAIVAGALGSIGREEER